MVYVGVGMRDGICRVGMQGGACRGGDMGCGVCMGWSATSCM